MTLIHLIKYLVHTENLKDLYKGKAINSESEALFIFLKDTIDLQSEVYIFDLEETDGKMNYTKDGVTYIQIFPLDLAIDLIESDLQLKDKGYSDLQIARRLLEYRIYDA